MKETYVPVAKRILADLGTLSGAASAAMRATNRVSEVRLAGDASPLSPAQAPRAAISISPSYFSTAGIRLVDGRTFTDADREATVPVAIVNAWAARHWWPKASAVGQMVRVDSLTVIIVGVVRDHTRVREMCL